MALVHNFCRTSLIAILCTLFTTSTTERTYTNEYAVYIPLGEEVADQLAERHGFTNHGPIGELENHFHFEHSGVRKRSTRSSRDVHAKLAEENGVEWIEQQHLKKRVKREMNMDSFTDPLWDEQWYLNGDVDVSMNIDRAWDRGYTGNGIVVSILDDGLETTHPDLINNYDERASYDVNDRDGDPTPRYDRFNTNQHGTRCAGEVAMEAGNSYCGVGVAFNASIGGIRMLDGPITDLVEAISLSIKKRYIDIYSSSWGPEDDGSTVEGPGTLAREAFSLGITKGRRGLGSIFVWASGNGGRRDSCSCDGYASSIYTISVSSVKENGKVPFYLEECASTLASTYSSGSRKSKKIVTADLNGGCSKHFSGTSASAPLAAGIVALALEANPQLTWRDMQYIIAMTAKPENLDGPWAVNGAGRHVSHRYGFGLMDAEAMVLLAEDWQNLPKQNSCPIYGSSNKKAFYGLTTLSFEVESDGCLNQANQVQYLEHVELNVTLTAKSRGDVSLVLISPAGTRSTLLPYRMHDRRRGSFEQWVFMSTHFWGERSEGTWVMEVHSISPAYYRGTLKSWSLMLRGTAVLPPTPANTVAANHHQVAKRDVSPSNTDSDDYFDSISSFYDVVCHEQCIDGCTGTAANECFRCKNFIDRDTRDCVESCPERFYPPPQTNRRCRRCHSSCKTCRGHEEMDCTSCKSKFTLTDNSECKPKSENPCEEGFYQDVSVCRACPSSCSRCRSEDECDECEQGMVLRGSSCVYRCKGNEYLRLDNDVLTCQPCHESCQSCFESGDDACLVCARGQYFNMEGKCESTSCGPGYFQDQNQDCAECPYACFNCTDSDTCTHCDGGWLLSDSECVLFCEEGTYSNGHDECVPCPDGCTICLQIPGENDPICLDCDDSHKLQDDGCVSCDGVDCGHCHPNCVDCWGPGVSQCSQCDVDYFLLDTTCVPFCPSNSYFPNGDSWTCDPCHESCQQCEGPETSDCTLCHGGEPTDGQCSKQDEHDECSDGCSSCYQGAPDICTECDNDHYLQFSSCLATCQEGYYGDERECQPCMATCRTCDNYDACTECVDNYLLHDGLCTTSCGDRFYRAGDRCLPCPDNCQLCAEDEDCHSCDEGYYLKGGLCVAVCGSGYTPVGKDCWRCDPSCVECNGPDIGNCTECEDESTPDWNGCPKTCDYGKFSDDEGNCMPCHSRCLTCDGPSNEECLSCDYYYFLTADNTCEISCPEGYYEDFERNVCVRCHKSCQTCIDGGPKNCIECEEEYYLLLTDEQLCVRHCPEGHYEAEDEGFLDCRICSRDCKGCVNSYLQCTSCKDDKYLYQTRCIDECPSGNPVEETRRCSLRECPKNCNSCNEWGDCTDCKEGYEEFFGECVKYNSNCPENQYRAYNDSGDMICKDCNSACASCLASGDQDCLVCADDAILSPDGRCTAGCEDGFFYEEPYCLACHPSCDTCNGTSPHDCMTCRDGLQVFLDPQSPSSTGPCVMGCPPQQFSQGDGDGCQKCPQSCGLCDGPSPTNCTSCKDGLYLLSSNNSCVAVCPSGTYHWHPAGGRDGFECKPCHQSCQTCFDGDESSCTSCKDETYRQQHICQDRCDQGYYAEPQENMFICQPCHRDCDDCLNGTASHCTACKGDKILYDNRCVQSCPVHFYMTTMYTKHKVCEECHDDCFSCIGSTIFECAGCYPGYELDDGICFSRCPLGQYFNDDDTINESCSECDDTCKECFGPGADQCIKCISGEVLQRIDTNTARCTRCCPPGAETEDDCCPCDQAADGRDICPRYQILQHRKMPHPPSPIGAVVFFCLLVVIAFLVIFGLLQARSNRQLCWRDNYSRLPTYYNSGNQFVKITTDPELDLDEGEEEGAKDYFSEDDVYGEMTDDEEEEEY